jgi:hypothetical protein
MEVVAELNQNYCSVYLGQEGENERTKFLVIEKIVEVLDYQWEYRNACQHTQGNCYETWNSDVDGKTGMQDDRSVILLQHFMQIRLACRIGP